MCVIDFSNQFAIEDKTGRKIDLIRFWSALLNIDLMISLNLKEDNLNSESRIKFDVEY